MFGSKKITTESTQDDFCAFDPLTLHDPVAMHTFWTPVNYFSIKLMGSARDWRRVIVPTHILHTISNDRIEFRTSTEAKLFSVLMILCGSAIFSQAFFPEWLSSGFHPLTASFFGLLAIGFGGIFFSLYKSPIVFDKSRGFFSKTKFINACMIYDGGFKSCIKLDQIHALQLLSKKTRALGYFDPLSVSYELNLVLKDGSRINVLDHSYLDKLRNDASILSTFLQIKIWDAIARKVPSSNPTQENALLRRD